LTRLPASGRIRAGRRPDELQKISLKGLNDALHASATRSAAEALAWTADVGASAPGRYADLIAVDGDPLADIHVLESVAIVIKGGQMVKGSAR
jgi:imidazolonepropionase-like amidohydrolase